MVGGGREHPRQTHLVDPGVVGGQRGLDRDRGDAGKRVEQGDQAGVAGQHHAGAALGDQRQVAGELDGVAEALLGVHQDGASGRIVAGPDRARQVDEVVAVAVVPLAPLVFGETAGEVAGQQGGDREVPVRLGQGGLEGDGGLAGGDRVGQAAARGQDEAEADMRLGQCGVESDRAVDGGLGRGQLVQVGEGVAQVEVGGGVGGICEDRGAQGRDGCGGVAQHAEGGAAQE